MTSEAEFEAKFPGQRPEGIPPSPTPENPGQVYPFFDIQDASKPGPSSKSRSRSREAVATSNPFLLRSAISKLRQCLSDTISVLESEEAANSADLASEEENPLLDKLRVWRKDLEGVGEINNGGIGSSGSRSEISSTPSRSAANGHSRPSSGGGMFAD
ncbi:hypothetical protein AX16_008741 [Volvariella volvacea WC 439]|nr:hypothetical protein AX16_008741 [Volvariella volvacea WC 439]